MDRFTEVKTAIKDKVPLADLIRQYTPVQPRGRNLVALCPFHNEKTPSFYVYEDSQHYKCYGCGKSGDVFSFLQEREGLDFKEAMEMLAERAGISLEGVFGRGGGQDSGKRDLNRTAHQVLGEVDGWFREQLHGPLGAGARGYLAERGLLGAATRFGLGYCPGPEARGNGLAAMCRDRKMPWQILEQSGLLKKYDGRVREVYGGRLIFPIADERGRVVAFGARHLPSPDDAKRDRKPPKYLNSPEAPWFNKRRVLFGLPWVKAAGTREVVVVEGYTDVLAAHMAGFQGAVASLGTALTADHARLLLRYATDGVVLLFDGDRAGRQAAERAYGELADTGLDLRIALAEEGLDPADMLGEVPGRDPGDLASGKAAFQALLDGAEPALRVWFRLLRDRYDFLQAVQLEKAVGECTRLLSRIEDNLRRAALLQEMARHLGMREGLLWQQLPADKQQGNPAAALVGRAPTDQGQRGPGGKGRGFGGKGGAWKGGKSGKWQKGGRGRRDPGPWTPETYSPDIMAPGAGPSGGGGRRASPQGSGGSPGAPDDSPMGAPGEEIPPPDSMGWEEARPADSSGATPSQVSDDDLAEFGLPGAAQPLTPPARPPAEAAPRGASPAGGARPAVVPPAPAVPRALLKAEEELLMCVLAEPGLHSRIEKVSFSASPTARLAERLTAAVQGGTPERNSLIQNLFTRCHGEPGLTALLSELVDRSARIRRPADLIDRLMADRESWMARRKSQDLRLLMQAAVARGDQAAANELLKEMMQAKRHGSGNGSTRSAPASRSEQQAQAEAPDSTEDAP